MTVYLVHGWRSRGEYMDRLAIGLRGKGYAARVIKYGQTFWRGETEQASFDAVVQLTKAVRKGDVVIGHSNGCNVTHDALRVGLIAETCIFLSPALDESISSIDYMPTLRRVHVWFTKKDWAVWLAKFVPSSDWGAMGRYGYQGNDERFINRDWSQKIGGHSHWFDEHLPQEIDAQLKGDGYVDTL